MAGVNAPVTTDAYLAKPLNLSKGDRLEVRLKHDDDDLFEFLITGEKTPSNPYGYPSSAARRDFFERMPERRESPGRGGTVWYAPTTDVTVRVVKALWPPEQVTLSPEATIVFQYMLATLEKQAFTAKRSALYHEHVSLRPLIQQLAVPTPKFVDSVEFAHDLRSMLHQDVAVANSIGDDGYALFMEQGTGKTPVAVARVCAESLRLTEKRMLRVIIVAPKNVRQNWVNEFAKFATVPGNVTVLRGGAMERIKLLIEALAGKDRPNDRFTVVVCSYEALSLSWDVIGGIEWDLAILDESHFIKWPTVKRSKFSHKLRDVAKARMILTGTPVCNTPIDLFSQLEFLRQGGSGFKSFEAFRKFYGVYRVTDPSRGTKRLVDVQNLPFMRERLSNMSFIVRKSEALPDLPDKVYSIVEVEMTNEQREVYEAVATQLYHEIKNDLEDEGGKRVNANNILTKMLRLAQITSGFVCYDAVVDLESGDTLVEGGYDRFDPNPKVEELMRQLKGDEDEDDPVEGLEKNEKALIWAHWIADIKTISARLTSEGIDHVVFMGSTNDADRQRAEHRFNHDPGCQVFLGTAGSGGTGLNLIGYPPGREDEWETDVTRVYYFSQDWSHPKRSQSEDRAHRRGTRRNVQIIDLCIPHTIDEEIRARVVNKQRMALEVQDLRTILSRVLGRTM